MEKLEPVTPDPRKLRNTALVLVAIMVLGGWLILKAYNTWGAKQKDDARPAKIHRIVQERSLRVLRQDGTEDDIFSLRGKVWVLHVICLSQPEDSRLAEIEMKHLAEKFGSREDFRLVTLVLDPPAADNLLSTLRAESAARGMNLPLWWLGANEAPTLHKFIRNELKPSTPPEKVGTRWHFDSSLILIDRDGHLTRPVIHQQRGGQPYVATFDFNEAAAWDARGVKTGTPLSNAAQLRVLLESTIETLLATPSMP